MGNVAKEQTPTQLTLQPGKGESLRSFLLLESNFLGHFPTLFSILTLLQLWSRVASLHPKQVAELSGVLHMILVLEARKIEEVMESSIMVSESHWGQDPHVRVVVFARRPKKLRRGSIKVNPGLSMWTPRCWWCQSPETSHQEELPTESGTNPKTDTGEGSWRRSHLSSLKRGPATRRRATGFGVPSRRLQACWISLSSLLPWSPFWLWSYHQSNRKVTKMSVWVPSGQAHFIHYPTTLVMVTRIPRGS